MFRCPKCSYLLVLLSHRRKYKCAKCSGLFSQKLIEDKDFRNSNIRQRLEERKQLKKERNREWNNSEAGKAYRRKYYYSEKGVQSRRNYYIKNRERIIFKAKEWHSKNKDKVKQYYLRNYRMRNREKESQRERLWRENNREKYNARKRIYWAKNKDRLNKRKRELNLANYESYLLNKRISYLRQRQRMLAQQYGGNGGFEGKFSGSGDSLSTF